MHGRGGADASVSAGGYYTAGAISGQVHTDQLPAQTRLKVRGEEERGLEEMRRELEVGEAMARGMVGGSGVGGVGGVAEDLTRAETLLKGAVPAKRAEDDLASVGLRAEEVVALGDCMEIDKDAVLEGEEDAEEEEEEDEEDLLRRELEKVRRERMEERRREEEEEEMLRRKEEAGKAALSNPLLAGALGGGEGSAGVGVRRRWDEDVVFRGQAPRAGAASKGFINDPLRNEFHKKFMRKYIK